MKPKEKHKNARDRSALQKRLEVLSDQTAKASADLRTAIQTAVREVRSLHVGDEGVDSLMASITDWNGVLVQMGQEAEDVADCAPAAVVDSGTVEPPESGPDEPVVDLEAEADVSAEYDALAASLAALTARFDAIEELVGRLQHDVPETAPPTGVSGDDLVTTTNVRRWFPSIDEAYADFIERVEEDDREWDLDSWVVLHFADLILEIPHHFTGEGWEEAIALFQSSESGNAED